MATVRTTPLPFRVFRGLLPSAPKTELYKARARPHVYADAGTYSVAVTVSNGRLPGAAVLTGEATLVVH